MNLHRCPSGHARSAEAGAIAIFGTTADDAAAGADDVLGSSEGDASLDDAGAGRPRGDVATLTSLAMGLADGRVGSDVDDPANPACLDVRGDVGGASALGAANARHVHAPMAASTTSAPIASALRR